MVFCILLPQSIISKVDEEWTFSPGHFPRACYGARDAYTITGILAWDDFSCLLPSEQTVLLLELTKFKRSKSTATTSDTQTFESGKVKFRNAVLLSCTLWKALGVWGGYLSCFKEGILVESRAMKTQEVYCFSGTDWQLRSSSVIQKTLIPGATGYLLGESTWSSWGQPPGKEPRGETCYSLCPPRHPNKVLSFTSVCAWAFIQMFT